MYEVDKNNNITATRGDAQKYSLDLKDPEGNVWQPEEGDTVRFAISTGYTNDANYELHYSQDIPTGSLEFTVPGSATKDLMKSEYNYDIEVTYADGEPDTVISGKMYLTGDVK